MLNARAYKKQDYVIRFLTGFSDQYDVVKSQIMLMDPLLDINRVFSMVLQHEQHSGSSPMADSQAFVNATEHRRSSTHWKGSGKICSFCGKDSHTVDVCYRKHGFPLGLNSGLLNLLIVLWVALLKMRLPEMMIPLGRH